MEDIAIMYGYDKIEELPLTSYTPGETKPLINFIDKAREIMINSLMELVDRFDGDCVDVNVLFEAQGNA